MKMHYVPAFLLEQFKDAGGLYQLVTADATCRPKNPDNCGFIRHLYRQVLETGLLKDIDTEVARICQRWIWGRKAGDVIELRPWQKARIAEWIGLATIRTPRRLQHFQRYVDEAKDNPQIAVDVLYSGRERALEVMRASSPAAYRELVEVLGRSKAETWMMITAQGAIRNGKVNYLPNPKESFNDYINQDRIARYAKHLLRMQWTWFYSAHGFVISDNPMAVWHRSRNNWQEDYGIARKGIEITFPFTRSLCLRLRRRQIRTHRVLYCNGRNTRRFNRRQLLGSYQRVFGPSKRIIDLAAQLKRQLARRA